MQRRLSIAIGILELISNPQILFLDETYSWSGCYCQAGISVTSNKSLNGKVTIIRTTHYLERST
jgi:ABC-type multidrug transport system ATPase subunit